MSQISGHSRTQHNAPLPPSLAKIFEQPDSDRLIRVNIQNETPENKLGNLIFKDALITGPKKSIPTIMDQETVDAKIGAAEARTDAKFADLRGDMRVGLAELTSKLDLILIRIDGAGKETASLRQETASLRQDVKETKDAVRSENVTTRWALAGAVLAILGIVAAMLAYGGDQLGRGVDWRDKVQSTVDQAIQQRTSAPPSPAAAQQSPTAPTPAQPPNN